MNGPQDIGGKQGFGSVLTDGPEPERPVFHSEWERRVFGLSFCSWLASGVSVDESRRYQSSLPYARYYGSSYYERWLYSLERLMVAKGVATERELDSGTKTEEPPPPLVPPEQLAAVATEFASNGVRRFRRAPAGPSFAVGAEVRAKRFNSATYDRLPSYLKGRRGTVDEHYGAFMHPEELAQGRLDQPGAHLYRVRFAADELWGESAEGPGDALCVDLFENYLEPA